MSLQFQLATRLSAVCTALLLNACPHAPQGTGGAGSTPPAGGGAAPAAQLSLAGLVDAVRAGEAQPVVCDWIAREKPYAEGYSFLEYPFKFGQGCAYYWGSWESRVQTFGAVRMLKSYLPVQVEFTLDWYAQQSGLSVRELTAEYLALYKDHQGTATDRTSADGKPLGKTYTYEDEGVLVRLFTRDELTPELAMFALMVKPERVEQLAELTDRYPELRQVGSADQPATLAELAALLETRGARGILDHFDFSGFKQGTWYKPLDGSVQVDYSRATAYQAGSFFWYAPVLCYLCAFDDGAQAELMFTPDWYASHAGHSAADLAAEFDRLAAAGAARSLTAGQSGEKYAVKLTWLRLGGVTVLRRQYLSAPPPGLAQYILYAGPDKWAAAPVSYPFWSEADLPEPAEPAGVFEQFIRELAIAPGKQQVLARYGAGTVRDERMLPLQRITPFVSEQYFDYDDQIKQERLLTLHTYNDAYLVELSALPRWLESKLGISQGELELEYVRLQKTHASRAGTPADAGSSRDPAEAAELAGDSDAAADSRRPASGAEAADQFYYGPVRVFRQPGQRGDGSDTRYVIQLPDWPD